MLEVSGNPNARAKDYAIATVTEAANVAAIVPVTAAGGKAVSTLVRAGEIEVAGELAGEAASTTKTSGSSWTWKQRKSVGGDGGSSAVGTERDAAGNGISKKHVVTNDGQIIHQHQDHIGTSGSITCQRAVKTGQWRAV